MTTPNTTASGAADALRSAMNRAFNLGQTYWQQADSESYKEQKKSNSTHDQYKALLEVTCANLAASAPVAPAPQPAPLTSSFVQTVPDKCDRIVWRNNYYHLPITQPALLQQGEYLPLPEPAIKACHCYSTNQVREAIDADRAARGLAQAAPAEIDAKSFQSYAETRAYSKGYYAGKKAAQAAPADVRNLLDYAMQIAHERELHVTGHKHDSEGATASFIAACERAFGTSVQPAPVAEDAEDAANWKWLAAYLVGPRTDRDDEIVASESVNALRKLVSAARAQAAQPEGGAK